MNSKMNGMTISDVKFEMRYLVSCLRVDTNSER